MTFSSRRGERRPPDMRAVLQACQMGLWVHHLASLGNTALWIKLQKSDPRLWDSIRRSWIRFARGACVADKTRSIATLNRCATRNGQVVTREVLTRTRSGISG